MAETMHLTVNTAEAASIWGSSALQFDDRLPRVVDIRFETADTDRDASGYAGA
jgi:hypothetical protein